MFYRKLYELVLSRFDLLIPRLSSSTNENHLLEKFIWNFFLYTLENHCKDLFLHRDLDQILLIILYHFFNSEDLFHRTNLSYPSLTWIKLIQVYKSMPNSRMKILRSVYLYPQSDHLHPQSDHLHHSSSNTHSGIHLFILFSFFIILC